MNHFVRSRRWRRAFVSACLPYIVASMCADFFHVHPRSAAPAAVAAEAGLITVSGTPPKASPGGYPCPACFWLRVSLRLEPGASPAIARQTSLVDVEPLETEWPASPVPPSAALRGPPRSALS